MSDSNKMTVPHLVTMENRERITITGVTDVGNFDESCITLDTELGTMAIRGERLHISAFDVATGQLCADGRIAALVYTGDAQRGGFFSRLFK